MKTAKIVVVIALAITVYIITNYPVINERVSYFAVFVCLSVVIFAIARIDHGDTENSYEETERKMDKVYEENGIFTYTEHGFYITRDHLTEEFKWNDIEKIFLFHISMGRDSQSGMEVLTRDKVTELYSSNTPGMEKFMLKINENLPIEDPSWTFQSTHTFNIFENAYTRKKLVYQKSN